MVPVKVLVNFGPLLQVLWVPVVRKVVLVHEVSHDGSTVRGERGWRERTMKQNVWKKSTSHDITN